MQLICTQATKCKILPSFKVQHDKSLRGTERLWESYYVCDTEIKSPKEEREKIHRGLGINIHIAIE